ncbi:urate oxidase [soil metagenome]
MSAILKNDNYGKSRVRVVKVTRKGDFHIMKEFSVDVALQGDFEDVHLTGNNANVLPTDTMKNTVYVMAKKNEVNSIEEYAYYLSDHFKKNNEQVSVVNIDIEQSTWKRIHVNGKEHDHAFISGGNEKRTCHIRSDGNTTSVLSGIKDLLIMKTTRSGFTGYIRDQYTTLNETTDRIFETVVTAKWNYTTEAVDYNSLYESIREEILSTFAQHDSLSVQQTLYAIGENVINKMPEIKEISISMPNRHCLLIDMSKFAMENNNEIFVPTDEPFGLIEATIIRDK